MSRLVNTEFFHHPVISTLTSDLNPKSQLVNPYSLIKND